VKVHTPATMEERVARIQRKYTTLGKRQTNVPLKASKQTSKHKHTHDTQTT
jgi:hypothetical protein